MNDFRKQIRKKKNTPILMVSAKKDDIDKIRGLGLGADDYVEEELQEEESVSGEDAALTDIAGTEIEAETEE